MTDPSQRDWRPSQDTYLSLCALVLEARRDDAFALIGSMSPAEQVDMWLSGCSVTGALATQLGTTIGIPTDEIPAWLRAMAVIQDPEGDDDAA